MFMQGNTPIGAIIAYAGQVAAKDSNPQPFETVIEATGWMVCDGRSLNIAQYPKLFSAIGYLYSNTEDGKHFNIPDYRGYFLRMVGSDASDASRESRKAINQNNSSIEIASKQDDAVQQHVHDYIKVDETGDIPAVTGGTADPIMLKSVETDAAISPEANTLETAQKVESKSSPQETRSKNISVYYVIKYT